MRTPELNYIWEIFGDDVCCCCCCYFWIRRGGRDCRCPSRPRLPWALWTICRRLQPRLASPIRNPTRRIWATGRKAAVAAAAAAALGAVAVVEWVAHFYHPPVIPEEPWSAVSAVTEPQSAAWAAVPGIVPCVVSLSVCPACVCVSCVCVVCVCTVTSGVHVCPNSS
jgi:hypothetical protein